MKTSVQLLDSRLQVREFLHHGAVIRKFDNRWEVFYFGKHGAECRKFDEEALARDFAREIKETE